MRRRSPSLASAMREYFAMISNSLRKENPYLSERIASGRARFVLFRAISGVLLATALERPEMLRSVAFEDQMVRMILGFLNFDMTPFVMHAAPGNVIAGAVADAPVYCTRFRAGPRNRPRREQQLKSRTGNERFGSA